MAAQEPVLAAAAAWMVRRQDGLTAEEDAELQAWLDADPSHGEALEELEQVWDRMDDVPQQEVEKLKAGLQDAAPVLAPSTTSGPGWLERLGRWARMPQTAFATLLVAVAAGWYGWQYHWPVYTQDVVTARGEQREIALPDGSTLWLDTATQAEIAFYHQRRMVRLREGQAQFQVQADTQRPFDVAAGDTRVTVVGTRFSVRHTTTGMHSGDVGVQVEQGRVRVEQNGRAALELGAGQALVLHAGSRVEAAQVQTSSAGSPWREGRVSFDAVPLKQVLEEFERYGDTGLTVRDPAIAALRVNGSFDLHRIDAFRRILPQVLPVRLQREGDVTLVVAVESK